MNKENDVILAVLKLSRAMRLGKLGEQIVLKSRFAFSKICFEGFVCLRKATFVYFERARFYPANLC